MLDGVDLTLRRLLLDQVILLRPATGDVDEDQVGFQPPDSEWRTKFMSGLGTRRALNVYLFDLRENAPLRSNEVLRDVNGTPTGQRPPVRVDCHYLVTAWSPAETDAGGRLAEHALLYDTMRVLLARARLVPAAVFADQPPPPEFPDELLDEELPITVVPAEGFSKLAEFWGAMGEAELWRPAIYLIVTVPVITPVQTVAALVTSRIARYRTDLEGDGPAEVRVAIGGRVLDATLATPATLPGAWVRLEDDAGGALMTTRTDAAGRFTFADLTPGRYRLRWRAGGRPEPAARPIDVPSPTGEYDLRFT